MAATPLVLWVTVGQSNVWGHGTTTYTVAGRHFRIRPSGILEAIGPGNMPLNSYADHPYAGGLAGVRNDNRYSFEGALLDALAVGMPGMVHCTIPCGANGSTSTEWINTLTTSPVVPSSAGFPAAAKMMAQLGLEMHNAILGGYILYQGESNALGGAADGAAWLADWDAFCDEVSTFHAADTWATNGGSGKKFAIVQLPPTYPSGLTAFGGNDPDWQSVRTNQATLVNTTRTAEDDCVLVASADPVATVSGENYHLETAALVALGTLTGETIAANWGL